MNIYLKEISLDDSIEYCDLLIELARYPDVYARPVPSDFEYEEFEDFKKARVRMALGENLRPGVMPTSTYWVMDGEKPIGYATLKHKVDPNKVGGHLGLCLKKEYQGKNIGTLVSNLLSKIAYNDLGIDKVIYTSKKENINSQKSLSKIGATFLYEKDGYFFYEDDLTKKFGSKTK